MILNCKKQALEVVSLQISLQITTHPPSKNIFPMGMQAKAEEVLRSTKFNKISWMILRGKLSRRFPTHFTS